MLRAAIVGASGYTGGEVLRLLHAHPHVEATQVTSERLKGRYVHTVHPNLRNAIQLTFKSSEDLEPCDIVFLGLPHGRAARRIEQFSSIAPLIVDLSADFRLHTGESYERWYGQPHPAPSWLSRFTYGLPEFHRDKLVGASCISGVGCNATAVNLALAPLVREELIGRAVVDLKVGSSEGGKQSSAASHHPERSGAMRSFAPVGHRHQAEVEQELGEIELYFSATAVEAVRGVLCTAHLFLKDQLSTPDLWRIFREHYGREPFIRLVSERRGLHRYPDPKVLVGTNFCDVGFVVDENTQRVVVLSAIDNLVKGAAGSAVQSMNLALGLEETAGLHFMGLHPL